MKVVILENAEAVAAYGANIFIQQLQTKADSVLGLATGSTPVALYRNLIEACASGAVSFKQARSFNLDEYLGLSGDHPQSYRYFMDEKLFNHIDIDRGNTHIPNGEADNPLQACADYEAAIRDCGGIDVQLLGLGRNGHIGFNEPSSSLGSRTRVKTLTRATIEDNSRFFEAGEFQPHLSVTMGIGTIMEARRIVLLATGASKAEPVKAMVEGPITASCPASILQMHPAATIIIDEDAAADLADRDFFKHIEQENRALLDRLSAD